MTRASAALRALAALGLVAAAAAIAQTSCAVHRRSEDLVCTTDADCTRINGGTCDEGYCVTASSGCPGPCMSCDFTDLTCEIPCNSGQSCGAVKCPVGFDCTIRCGSSGCGDIDCAGAQHCKIDCSGQGACGNINCGAAACEITCSGQGACPSIDCTRSCQCDVTCNSSGAACPSMSCPTVPITGQLCTRQGTAGANCDSNPPGCDTCPAF